MGLVGSKTRSLGQILEKPCVCSRPDFWSDTHEAWSEFATMKSCTCLKMGHVESKTRSLGQIIEDPMLVTEGL